MLVLSRKTNQQIIIDGNIVVEVLKVKGNTVRLGIKAPNDVHIRRGELPQKEKEFGLEPLQIPATPESRVDEGVAHAEPDEYANITIVFSNETESDESVELLPFQPATKDCDSRITSFQPPQESNSSIEFRGKVPTPLHRNRLAELASKVTIDSNR